MSHVRCLISHVDAHPQQHFPDLGMSECAALALLGLPVGSGMAV